MKELLCWNRYLFQICNQAVLVSTRTLIAKTFAGTVVTFFNDLVVYTLDLAR